MAAKINASGRAGELPADARLRVLNGSFTLEDSEQTVQIESYSALLGRGAIRTGQGDPRLTGPYLAHTAAKPQAHADGRNQALPDGLGRSPVAHNE